MGGIWQPTRKELICVATQVYSSRGAFHHFGIVATVDGLLRVKLTLSKSNGEGVEDGGSYT